MLSRNSGFWKKLRNCMKGGKELDADHYYATLTKKPWETEKALLHQLEKKIRQTFSYQGIPKWMTEGEPASMQTPTGILAVPHKHWNFLFLSKVDNKHSTHFLWCLFETFTALLSLSSLPSSEHGSAFMIKEVMQVNI